MKKSLLIFLLLSDYFFASAGGFQVINQSQTATAMGGSLTGVSLDGSVVFFNPGGISFADSNYINGGISLLLPQTTYLGPYSGSEKMSEQVSPLLYLYGTYNLKGKWSAGLSVNNPFHQQSKWEDNWSGRYISQETKFNTLAIQPSVSYRLSDHIAIGAGPSFNMSSLKVKKALPYMSAASEDVIEELKAKTSGIGFNAGIYGSFGKIFFGC